MKNTLSIFSKSLTFSLLAVVILFTLELVYSLFSFRFSATSFWGLLNFSFLSFLLLAGAGLLLSVVQGASVWLLAFLSGYLRRRFDLVPTNLIVSFAVSLLLCPYFIFFSSQLFSGDGISAHSLVGLLRIVFPIFACLVALGLCFVFLHKVYPRFLLFTKRQHIVLTGLAALVLVGVYVANAGFYVGQYLFVHQLAFFVMFIVAEIIAVGVCFFLRNVSGSYLRVFRWLRFVVLLGVVILSIIGVAQGGVLLSSKSRNCLAYAT